MAQDWFTANAPKSEPQGDWFAANAPREPDFKATVKATDTFPDHVSDFAGEVGHALNPVEWVKGLYGLATDLVGTAKAIGMGHGRLYQEAESAFQRGDYVIAGRKFLHYLTPILGPAVMDPAADDFAAGRYGAGLGKLTGFAAQMALPGAISKAGGARVPLAPTNVNAAERAAVEFGMREGIPVDAATATGSRFVRGTQRIADESFLGSQVGQRAAQSQADALTATGERLAARTSAVPVTAEQAGQGVRDAVTNQVRVHHGEANTAYAQVRALEAQRGGVPVDVAPAKAALRPIYDALMREKDLAPLYGGKAKALVALDKLMNAPDTVPLSVADSALGDIKALARGADMPELRGQGQGIAARAVSELDGQVRAAAAAAGQDVADALQAGRAATRAKYATADVLDALRGEPVQVFNQLTASKDSAVALLRQVAREAPGELPTIGRAYLEGLLQKATAEGGFNRAQGLMADWQRLGPESKRLMFRDQGLVNDLDQFFLLAKRMADNPNPSGTAFTLFKGGELGLLWREPVTGISVSVGAWGLSKLLHNPRAVRVMVRGLRLPATNRAAAATATAELTEIARESGVLAPGAAERESAR